MTRKLGTTRRLRGRNLGIVAALVAIPFACKEESSNDSDDSGAASTTSTSSSTGGASSTTGTQGGPSFGVTGIGIAAGGASSTSTSGFAGGGAGGECAGEQHTAELIPLDVYIMLDRSLSMNAPTASGASKWDAITQALEAFVSDPGSEGIGVGIQYFPANKPCASHDECEEGLCYLKACRITRNPDPRLPGLVPCQQDADCDSGDTCEPLGGCGDQSCVAGAICSNGVECTPVTSSVCASQTVCTLSDYTAPEVPIGTLPDSSEALLTSLAAYSPAQSPFGLTPTGPALEGAIAYARSWAEEHPERKVIVVLATDGAPTGGCSPSRRSEIAALASGGAGATVPVHTYTIGVFEPEDPDNPTADATEGPDTIRAIAEKGKGQAFVISDQDDVAAQFVAALNSVRSHGLSCEFQIPEPRGGDELDYGKVNVEFTPRAGDDSEIIPYVGDDSSACTEEGGWYYYPSRRNPVTIRACESTCERLTSSATGNVAIEVGCKTVIFDPIK